MAEKEMGDGASPEEVAMVDQMPKVRLVITPDGDRLIDDNTGLELPIVYGAAEPGSEPGPKPLPAMPGIYPGWNYVDGEPIPGMPRDPKVTRLRAFASAKKD